MNNQANKGNEDEIVDFRPLISDIVGDVSHVILGSVDKSIENYYYSVTMDGTDNTVSIVFEHPIYDQTRTAELIVSEIQNGISPYADPKGITVLLLKPSGMADIMAEIARFSFD